MTGEILVLNQRLPETDSASADLQEVILPSVSHCGFGWRPKTGDNRAEDSRFHFN